MKNVKGGDETLFSIPWPQKEKIKKSSMISHCLKAEEFPLIYVF